MAGQNDFLVFDDNDQNILTQEGYVADTDRLNGFKRGLARSIVTNKVLKQTSTMASAIGEYLKDNNLVATDTSVTQLKNAISGAFVSANSNQTIGGTKTFANTIQGTADKALKDGNGDVIADTYLKVRGEWEHALKAYSDNGELLTDAEGLADVKSYAHSTFDKSKFSVVGSPNITDDGIATVNPNLSTGNRVETPFIPADLSGHSWKIRNRWINKGITIRPETTSVTHEAVTAIVYPTAYGSLLMRQGRYLQFSGRFGDSSDNTGSAQITAISKDIGTHDFVDMEIAFDITTGVYTASYNVGNGWEIAGTYTPTTSEKQLYLISTSQTDWQIGISSSVNVVYNDVDLKYTSVEIDGVPIFSGNKTGIDTIKPDDYTVVGTPTITDDMIITSAPTGNYVKTSSINLASANTWAIELAVKPKVSTLSSSCALAVNADTKLVFSLSTNLTLSAFYNVGSANTSFSSSTHLTVNVWNKIRLAYNGTAVEMFLLSDNSWTKIGSNTSANTTLNNFLAVGAGQGSLQIQNNEVEIDLNSFKIYGNGNLVYQPCLKIPYTESKTGAKIVSSFYRDRVNDMAKQFGYANYYTLDEDNGNFTLPQVELYGYIEKRARDIAHPVAQPFYRFSDEINEDEVRLEGAEVDKGLYLAIEQKLAAYCTASEDTTKIILPNFTDRVPWGSNTQGYIEAGLPNITGDARFCAWASTGATGAFSQTQYNYGFTQGGSNGGVAVYNSSLMKFNASDSSPIYGNSPTVQPPAFKVRWLARWK